MSDATTTDPVALVEELRLKRLRQAMAFADELEFSDDERHELSIMVVGPDRDPSWAGFDLTQMDLLVANFQGYAWIGKIMSERGPNHQPRRKPRNPTTNGA